VRIRPEDAGGIAVETHERASRARFDEVTGDVVAASDGAFVQYGTGDDASTEVVAQLTDAAAEGD
jgi:hypothetical protein